MVGASKVFETYETEEGAIASFARTEEDAKVVGIQVQ
jgi:hypothetical protein